MQPSLTVPLGPTSGFLFDLFEALAYGENLRRHEPAAWPVEDFALDRIPGAEVVLSHGARTAILRLDGGLVRATMRGSQLCVAVASPSAERSAALIEQLKELFPPVEPDPTSETTVAFWNWGGLGPSVRTHAIRTPCWADVRGNYAAAVLEPLDALLTSTEPSAGGRLLLWHGPPGTGKTHLIRALAHAWQEWCSAEYVVDIDALLHGSSEYLTSVLLDRPTGPQERPWRLLILEDAGEFLAPDAAAAQGQGFSRLLNTLDGMLGQSTDLLVLATTNRPLGDLDPAIVRPGRCALQLEIPELPAGEAAAWLAARGHAGPIAGPATIAQLYGVLRGDEPPRPRRAIGFAA